MGRYPRGSSSNSSRSCLCSLCCSLVKLILTLGVVVFIFWLIYRPTKIKAYVDSASLTQFTLTNSTALDYDLALNLSIRNPNSKISFYYDYIEAQAFYDATNFGQDKNLPTFFQRHKNTTSLHLKFSGRAKDLGPSVNGTFSSEKSAGIFGVEVKVFSRVRVKVLFLKFGHFKTEIDCGLKIPAPRPGGGGGGGGGGFEKTQCGVDF